MTGEPEHWVTWTKGSGKNHYYIDSETYDKVGRDAPPPLQAWGFKEVLLGARLKDDGTTDGGETLRPQIAHQYDPVFVLDRPGSFLNELMVKLSRLGVLQRAGRQCSLDLRQKRSYLSMVETQLREQETTLAAYEPAVALRDRLPDLQRRVKEVEALTVRLDQLRQLATQRARLVTATARALPLQNRVLQAHEDLLQKVEALRSLQGLRARLVDLPKLPKPLHVKKTDVAAYQKWAKLAPLQSERRTAAAELSVARSGLTIAEKTVTRLEAEIDAFKDAHPLCPVCNRPW